MSTLNESVVEEAALGWLGSLGFAVLHGSRIAPGGEQAEREDYRQVLLLGRLRRKLADVNPSLPPAALDEAVRKLRLVGSPSLIENNRAFHRLLVEGVDVEFTDEEGRVKHDKACWWTSRGPGRTTGSR